MTIFTYALRIRTRNGTDHVADAVCTPLSTQEIPGLNTNVCTSIMFVAFRVTEYVLSYDVFTIVSGFFPLLLHPLTIPASAYNKEDLFVPACLNC